MAVGVVNADGQATVSRIGHREISRLGKHTFEGDAVRTIGLPLEFGGPVERHRTRVRVKFPDRGGTGDDHAGFAMLGIALYFWSGKRCADYLSAG